MQGLNLLRDLLAAEVIATVNVALCEYHTAHCPASEQLTAECKKVRPFWHSCRLKSVVAALGWHAEGQAAVAGLVSGIWHVFGVNQAARLLLPALLLLIEALQSCYFVCKSFTWAAHG